MQSDPKVSTVQKREYSVAAEEFLDVVRHSSDPDCDTALLS